MLRLVVVALTCSIIPLQAGVLWYQPPDAEAFAFADQEFRDDFPAHSTYQVHDVTVGAGGWTIQSITSYFTLGYGYWPATASVYLNIFSKSDPLPGPGDDPTAGTEYTASISDDGAATTFITLDGLSISLAAGDYWIGMTPILDFGSYGQEYHMQATAVLGDYSAIRNPGGAMGYGTDWGTYAMVGYDPGDGAILIEGTAIPEPATWSLLALGVGALAFLRRRK